MGRLINETDLMNLLCALDDARHELCYAIKKIPELPEVDAIPRDQYEARLKADMVAILDKVRNEIDKIHEREGSSFDCLNALDELKEFIDKIKAERGVEDGKHF